MLSNAITKTIDMLKFSKQINDCCLNTNFFFYRNSDFSCLCRNKILVEFIKDYLDIRHN